MKKNPLKKCYECDGRLEVKDLPYKLRGVLIGNFPAEVCNRCGEAYYDEQTSRRMTKAAKEKGLWGIESTTKVNRIGDSLGVIINKRIADFMGLKKGELVRIYPEGRNRIIIEV